MLEQYDYLDWLSDNDLEDTDENLEKYMSTHCQFCGGSNEYGECGCDHEVRY